MGARRNDGHLVRPLMEPNTPLFLCPICRQPLPFRPPCPCGFVLRESEGILNLIADQDAEAMQPFLNAYEQVRTDEQWGDDDLDLPFHPRRHREVWAIRQRTFRKLETLFARSEKGFAADIGAGNCWLTRYLDAWGFDSIAVDANTSGRDGLGAGQKFINEGARFLRVRSTMERLPFVSGRITLLTTNAAFHYASDFRASLGEFKRVLTPGGRIAILDTPVYKSPADGERMMAERATNFRQRYGISEELARKSRYLTFDMISELAAQESLQLDVQPVWPGWRRQYDQIRGRLVGKRIAEFPVILLQKAIDG